jgi:hypothetical protein
MWRIKRRFVPELPHIPSYNRLFQRIFGHKQIDYIQNVIRNSALIVIWLEWSWSSMNIFQVFVNIISCPLESWYFRGLKSAKPVANCLIKPEKDRPPNSFDSNSFTSPIGPVPDSRKFHCFTACVVSVALEFCSDYGFSTIDSQATFWKLNISCITKRTQGKRFMPKRREQMSNQSHHRSGHFAMLVYSRFLASRPNWRNLFLACWAQSTW